MSLPKFSVTYEVVTEESAEQGEAAERGYYSRGGWKHDDPSEWTLHEIVAQFGRNSLENSGSWLSTMDADTDYRSGDATSYGIHPPKTITAASYARLVNVLCWQPKRRN